MMDNFLQEYLLDESKSLNAPEFEPYRFINTSGLGKFIESMTNISMGQFKKGEEEKERADLLP